jgi:serine/threonine protein kinase
MTPSVPAAIDDPCFEAALAEYFDQVDAGKTVDHEAFLRKHATVATALREFWRIAEQVERMAGPSASDLRSQTATNLGSLDSSFPGQAAAKSSPTMLNLPEQIGRYRIEKTLGQGGTGTVFLAYDPALDRRVALKVPTPATKGWDQILQRFQREARAAAVIRHPNICPVYDVGDTNGYLFISMAYIEGRPLADYLKETPQFPLRQAVRIVRKLALALQAAHAHGVIHRDLKPTNIIIDRNAEPIITDFGLARQIRMEDDPTVTREGQIIGSPAYMSPEQIEGGQVGPESDVFSLGVIFYEMLAGCRPFQGSLTNMFAQIVSGTITPPSQWLACSPFSDPGGMRVSDALLGQERLDDQT